MQLLFPQKIQLNLSYIMWCINFIGNYLSGAFIGIFVTELAIQNDLDGITIERNSTIIIARNDDLLILHKYFKIRRCNADIWIFMRLQGILVFSHGFMHKQKLFSNFRYYPVQCFAIRFSSSFDVDHLSMLITYNSKKNNNNNLTIEQSLSKFFFCSFKSFLMLQSLLNLCLNEQSGIVPNTKLLGKCVCVFVCERLCDYMKYWATYGPHSTWNLFVDWDDFCTLNENYRDYRAHMETIIVFGLLYVRTIQWISFLAQWIKVIWWWFVYSIFFSSSYIRWYQHIHNIHIHTHITPKLYHQW